MRSRRTVGSGGERTAPSREWAKASWRMRTMQPTMSSTMPPPGRRDASSLIFVFYAPQRSVPTWPDQRRQLPSRCSPRAAFAQHYGTSGLLQRQGRRPQRSRAGPGTWLPPKCPLPGSDRTPQAAIPSTERSRLEAGDCGARSCHAERPAWRA